MRCIKNLFILIGLCLLNVTFIQSASAQRSVSAKAISTKTSIKPLNAKALNLNPKAARILQRWIEAKHVELLETGHFVPMANPPANTGANLPGGGTPNSFSSGTNCVKIECPDVFGDDVVCWECH